MSDQKDDSKLMTLEEAKKIAELHTEYDPSSVLKEDT